MISKSKAFEQGVTSALYRAEWDFQSLLGPGEIELRRYDNHHITLSREQAQKVAELLQERLDEGGWGLDVSLRQSWWPFSNFWVRLSPRKGGKS